MSYNVSGERSTIQQLHLTRHSKKLGLVLLMTMTFSCPALTRAFLTQPSSLNLLPFVYFTPPRLLAQIISLLPSILHLPFHIPLSPSPSLARHSRQAEWQERRVWEASCLSKWNLTAKQRRMLHLITRGPRYTQMQARSLRSLVGEMRRQYSNATLSHGGVTLRGEGDVTHLMRTCRDPGVLLWAWRAWHDTIGPPARPLFTRAVGVMNSAARQAGVCGA
ncbi:Angiotensin-converting enzyme [Portunus trituberculatus]|uniref:Angiotensin-converting enzyme n=1 Tax=Portunus trituberculatus TaxID=210409 RepID=A0A5B7H8K4_PORTR|nr:Angiotensin-converting enzyme [Portunus trituberculatus]